MAWTERYMSPTGGGAHNGTTAGDAWTMAEAITNVAAGNRVNVIAGTYANAATGRTFATAGTTTAPIWWRGYNSAIGDLDADFTTTKPSWTFTSAQLAVSGAHQIFSNLSVVATTNTASAFSVTAGMCRFDRLRVENQNAASGSRAINNGTAGANDWSRCWFKTTSTASEVALVSFPGSFTDCALEGGGSGINATASVVCLGCAFNNNGAHGLLYNVAGSLVVIGCTFYSPTNDGIRISTLPVTTGFHLIAKNLFSECGGYGINNASGANTNIIPRVQNDFYLCTSGNENGFGDSPSLSQLAEVSDPFTNAAGGDLSLVTGALAKAGAGGLFENQSYSSYLDAGAVQRQEASAGAGVSGSRIFGGF